MEEIENSQVEIVRLEVLENHGINTADLQKLKVAGICTVKGLQMATRKNLAKVKGLSEIKIEKLKEAASKLCSLSPISAMSLFQRRSSVVKLTTGSTQLDGLLGGGIESMSITELFGEFRTGKTQICMTLCVSSQAQSTPYKIAFIDTEGTFRPERLEKIAERYSLDYESVLENILYSRVHNTEHQTEVLDLMAAYFAEDASYRLLIVDSVINLFRTDYGGRGELGERQQKLNVFLSKLMKIAEEFNIAVVLTNQMMSDPSGGLTFVADPKKPVGGHVLAHASTTRLYLRKGKGEVRIAKVYDSPSLPEAEATFSISETGIVDAEE